jgi:XRE family aerobic/anaerobic benzoate catabolism transcriptional regulator
LVRGKDGSIVPAVSGRRPLLEALGAVVRARRQAQGMTVRALAGRSGVSERFLAQVEGGVGNISVARLDALSEALESTAGALLTLAEAERAAGGDGDGRAGGAVALLGLRGAGKSTIGPRLAKRLKVPFVELDASIEAAAGMRLATLFEIHGMAYYRRLEREVLRRVLAEHAGVVLAVGGSLVTDEETYGLLRARAFTVWLRANADDHWDRVVAQGDARPMAHRANARSELQALLRARAPLYARARATVDTSALGLRGTVDAVLAALRGDGTGDERSG